MISAIIFDCFGVIVGKGFNYTYSQAGGDPTSDKAFIADMLGQANLGLISDEHFRQAMATHLGISKAAWLAAEATAELPDAELLTYIKRLRSKYKTAILSNANTGTLASKIGAEQLKASFDEVIASADVGLVKPDPKIYQELAARLGVKPEECIFIDDQQGFLNVGLNLGMKVILYKDFSQLKKDLNQLLTSTADLKS